MTLLPARLSFLVSSSRTCWLSFLLTNCQRAQFLPCAPPLRAALSLPPSFLHGTDWFVCLLTGQTVSCLGGK